MQNKNLRMAEKIAACVAQKGGRTFFVGGCVRDRIAGIENKDIDIEIHGISPEDLASVLDQLGKRTEMGASFGIFGLKGYDLDIAMPRKEEATGRGHKDFNVFVDPFLGTRKAAMRRDFTMNALMEDVLTGEVLDHFGGIEDLKNKVLRHVNDDTFAEDPLRVLRAAQFAARFEFTVAPETVSLAKTMDLTALARERVFEELKKALLKADKPSIFFEVMKEMEQLSCWFPEVEQLEGVRQNSQCHPEGDVWNHTMLVLDQAAKLKKGAENPVGFMLAALSHDFDKVMAEKEIRIFLKRLTNETKLIKYVVNMDELHREPNMMFCQKGKKEATNKMFDRSVDPQGLLLLARADYLGRENVSSYDETESFLQERLAYFYRTMEKPCVMGADLVKAGLQPGPDFSEYLNYAHSLHLAGVEKEEALTQTMAYVRRRKKEKKEQDEC
ncbi:MAG: CCA tRNA nucleotidyltransferase [Ruminococcus sp.]